MSKKPKVNVLPIEQGATPDPQNANKHTARGGALLENSLQRRGAFRSIASAGKGVDVPVVYAGNYTLEKAAAAGFKEIVNVHVTGDQLVNVVRDDIAPHTAEAIALGLEDNEIGKQSYSPDIDLIASLAAGDSAILSALKNEDKMFGGMLATMGVREETIDAEPQIDRAEELQKKWQVQRGGLYQIGAHRLLCGDSTKREDVERVMGGEKATLLFTDPPYGVSIGDKNKFLNKFSKSGRVLTSIESDDDSAEDLGDMLLQVFTLSKDFLTDDCSVFVCSPQGGSLGMMMMMMMMRDAGLEVRHVLNWVKNSPTFSLGRLDYDYQHEPILFTWIKKHKKIMGGQFKSSVWNIDKPVANKEHPTMKPVELYVNALLNHTDINDILYEPFGGSGTGMVAAQNTGRACRMVELTPSYCAVILERMSTAFPELEIKKL